MESGSNLPNPGTYPGGDRQQFCVSWNSHQSNMHSAFPKLLSSEQFVDVTLACDGGSIKCHKVVLSACSDYLERLLLEIPCTHPVIFLRDMKMWELQALVEFMYRGEVYVEQQQLATLMQAAEVLQVLFFDFFGMHYKIPSIILSLLLTECSARIKDNRTELNFRTHSAFI